MKCIYCGKAADCFTSMDNPICSDCAKEKGFQLCTKLGKHIEDKDFYCDNNCNDCIHNIEQMKQKQSINYLHRGSVCAAFCVFLNTLLAAAALWCKKSGCGGGDAGTKETNKGAEISGN